MLSRWSDRLLRVLSAQFRRGALFVLATVTALTLTLSPVLSSPAGAQFGGLSDLLGSATGLTEGTSSCAIDMVGWVICPTMRTIAKLADYGWTYINQNFLTIDYNIASNTSGTYTAWQLMRNVADALFVVAFMILVYSQLTGRGGTYNIKRLLPKLIICAILVNVSYYICVIFIDITNIIGNSMMAIFQGVASKVGTEILPIGATPSAGTDGALTVITAAVLGKTGTVWVLLAPVAAVIVSVATICALGVVLLIMRKTVVAMLILFSPILFVAYLLPNLEKYFQQGVRLFIQLLMLYPIVAILLGAGQIVSATIVTVGSNDANYRVSGDSYLPRNGGSGSAITDTTAAAAAVVPLLAVWFIFKNMSSVMSTAGSRLSASIAGRRGGKDGDKAKVTGNAVAGAAGNLGKGVGGPFNRRQAYSRNRRKSSLSGSALTDEDGLPPSAGQGARQPAGANAQNALQNSLQGQTEDTKKQLEGLNDAKLSGSAEGLDIENAMTDAIAQGTAKKEENKKLTAKDLFSNLNRSHESKDKERKFSSGPGPAGGGSSGGGGGGGAPQPSAPSTSYRAPSMAQGGNIVSGTSVPSQPSVTKIVAVPVQVNPTELLNQQHPPDNVSQPPISGTEEKAKARAQKYLYDSQRDIDEARQKLEVLGHKDEPDEPPHSDAKPEDDKKDKGSS